LILSFLAQAAAALPPVSPSAIRFEDLGLSPIALDLGFFKLRWYSLAYLAGILIGWWYLLRLLVQPGAPMARRHADDMIFYATLGIIIGGRVAYILFYQPSILQNPLDILKLWEGGMSLHGGLAGVLLGIWYLARKNDLSFLRICDYVACVAPFGLLFGRLANFVNGELWGRPTDVPWAMIFPTGGEVARHPSQLYEAGLEGLLLGAVLLFMFWRTDARYHPGKLFGTGLIIYGVSRFLVEFVRQPDPGLENLSWGLSMGQTLTVPLIIAGAWLVATARARRVRVEGVAGTQSVA
jgi:phosphatidylglycerol:prolipoprotein diacylglycerol transferase